MVYARLWRILSGLSNHYAAELTSRIADGIEFATDDRERPLQGPLAKLKTSSLRNLISIYLNSTIEPKILIAGNYAA